MELERIVAGLVEQVEHRFYGMYRGFVVDNQDPAHLGRLKLRVPSVLGSDVVTGWATPCVPYGGAADQGFLFIPEREAGVWVQFEEGDLEFPIWVGAFWSKPESESELPKPNKADGSEETSVQDPPTRKIIKTLKGHTLQFEDKDGEDLIIIWEATNQNVITLNKDGIKITDGANGNSITMDKDGTSVEDKNSNTITMDENGIVVEDKNSNTMTMGPEGILVEDKNSNKTTLNQDGILSEDKNGNKIMMSQNGTVIEDKNGNKITMGQNGTLVEDKNSNKIELTASAINIFPAVQCNLGNAAINMVNNLPACLFSGAPHAMDAKGHAKILA